MTENRAVLVVDDSKVSRIVSVGYLRKLRPGLPIVEAANADEARSAVAAQPIEWILLDHNMPGISGLDLAESLRATHPHVRIALLTANIQDATQARAASLGVHFFKKPIREALIAEILAKLEAVAA